MSHDTPNAKPRVLFVDDEQRILTSLKMLCRRDYDVRIAHGGEAALEVLRNAPVDVIVSDQRMPGMTGIELLRQARELQPRAMRLLLTGYADLNAIIGSINEGEIFRFISKPWSNDDLKATLAQAAEAAGIDVADEAPAPESGGDAPAAAPDSQPGVLVLEPDETRRRAFRDVLGDECRLFEAETLDGAVERLQQHDIGVIISDVRVQGTPIVDLLNPLKRYQPHLVSMILTDRADAHDAIELINRSQVYRFLLRPLRPAMCRISVRSALQQHAALKRNPERTRRHRVQETDERAGGLGEGLVNRIRMMRSRLGLT
ncbi:serine/threonine protein kinase [Salinisphaera sp. PC39]|uniref:response regulator n=1 Tax=Salinisphaera sp. PC39 TaxID=1304156 RepID=UPI00333F8257